MTQPMIKFQADKTLLTSFGKQQLEIAFELEQGQLLTLYGASGAGKTTILRILSGLTEVRAGKIVVDGETWQDTQRRINVPTRRRSIGFVFQDFALFPNLSVKENLRYALQKGDDTRLMEELIELMELGPLQDVRPAFLSGGQQQRVALARAIIRKPKLLLLDEPLSALDDDMRRRLQDYIEKIRRHYELTTILVSHDLPEILRLSDEVIWLDRGKIRQQGPPGLVFPSHSLNPRIPGI
ncbi:ATP-binding cassette domain-containing protein [Flavitalea sp. BT771]|uniref:ATP-binding cassette domain-containing protein n=1 Tax=Flavitalea sp. BT771 TaxID=3063329 RepID=UPI0026E1594B|nr:ATP-binding cassette domain-containing protein [Flavitalea sp. BT771]MDO6432313.1 ATP-binding cassette domain-containing protein [Flavitalea sp. BT771]MDV6221223.1 ATP-binding cassette domain-containing protein [Flavitalea sp. BT771]